MSNNTSTQPGFLTPVEELVPTDEILEDAITHSVSGISGLPREMVRPTFGTDEAGNKQLKQPNNDVNWVAVQLIRTELEDVPQRRQTSDDDGQTILTDTKIREFLLSFFGPNGSGYAERFRDGLYISQNRDALRSLGLNLIECGNIITAASLKDNTFRPRYDVNLRLRHVTQRTYNVRNVIGAQGVIVSDGADPNGDTTMDRPFNVKR